MGICAVAEDCGVTEKLANFLMPFTQKVFKTKDKQTNKFLATNLTCNFLGFGGAATPYAVKAIDRLDKEGNSYAPRLLFVINATSIQLIPATVISLRAAAGSVAPNDIMLPSFLASLLSTSLAVVIFLLCQKFKGASLNKRTRGKKLPRQNQAG
jgi:spore maturation protein A